MTTRKLVDIAKTIRSKNAGVDKITFDIIFETEQDYRMVLKSRSITRASISKLYSLRQDRITDFEEFDPAFAIKFTILRDRPSGSPGDPDIFGAQQYAPLMDIEISE
ncbi:MAG: DUF4387 domain-containing protein [Rhizobiales bacterium]|nr:DUF4387 domain-containing protein [Hyphomicrobiales bacterium]NRB13317.1 DUF4387 domain-containing protein [Hyphomicrobiales bacterium]